jgi:hypothetical protein
VVLRDRVRVSSDPSLRQMSSEVVLGLRDGEVLRGAHDSSLPAVDLAEQGKRLEAKFRSLAAPVVGEQAAEIVTLIGRLGTLDDLGALMDRLRA